MTRKSASKTSNSRHRGFTLIEVVLAMTIIVSGIVIVAASWSGNLLRVRNANLYSNVAYLLEKKMTEIDLKYKNGPIANIPESEEGDFGKEYANFRWKLESQEFELPDLTAYMGGEGQEGGADETAQMLADQMSQIMKKAVKEVKLTVFAKVKEKENQFTITTFYVDYGVDISAPPGGGTDGGGP